MVFLLLFVVTVAVGSGFVVVRRKRKHQAAGGAN
jgi:LPXTG-motif cell wall-anchored protein